MDRSSTLFIGALTFVSILTVFALSTPVPPPLPQLDDFPTPEASRHSRRSTDSSIRSSTLAPRIDCVMRRKPYRRNSSSRSHMISARHMLDHLKDLLEDTSGSKPASAATPATNIQTPGSVSNATPALGTTPPATTPTASSTKPSSHLRPTPMLGSTWSSLTTASSTPLSTTARSTNDDLFPQLLTMDAESLLYVFQSQLRLRIKRNQLDHFTDEQMDLIENNILPDLDKVLSIEQAIPPDNATTCCSLPSTSRCQQVLHQTGHPRPCDLLSLHPFRKLKEKSMVMPIPMLKVWTIRTICGDVMSSTSGSRTIPNTTGRRSPRVADAKSESSSK